MSGRDLPWWSKVHVSAFVSGVQFAAGIAKDPTCDCYGVSTYIGDPAIRWFTKDGKPEPGRTPVPGTTIAERWQSAGQYNPFGMAFAPDGTLYFIDIHIACTGVLTNCGPASYGGRVMRVTFSDGQPSTPVTVASGFDFPTSVTVCVPAKTVCPYPSGKIKAPLSGPSENPTPAVGTPTDAPAKAGFG